MIIIEFLFIIIFLLIIYYFLFLIFFPLLYAFLGKIIYNYFQKNFEKFKKYVDNSEKGSLKNYFLFYLLLIFFHIPLELIDYVEKFQSYSGKKLDSFVIILEKRGINMKDPLVFRKKILEFYYLYPEKDPFVLTFFLIHYFIFKIVKSFTGVDFHFFRNYMKILYEKNFSDLKKESVRKIFKFLNVDNSRSFPTDKDLEKVKIFFEIELEKLGIIRSKQNNDDIQKRYEKLKEIKNLKIEKYKNDKNISEKDLNKNLREKTENKITDKIDFSLEKKLDSESIKNFEVKNIFDDYEDVMKSFEK